MNAPIIPHNWQLPEYFRGRLGSSVGRQRSMNWENQLLLVVHNFPTDSESKISGQLFWMDPSGKWLCSNGKPGALEMGQLITKYEHAVQQFDSSSHKLQSSGEYLEILESLGPIKRGAKGLYETLQAARESMTNVREIIDWRDRIEEVMYELEQLFEDVKNAMDFALIRQAEIQARISQNAEQSAHRLNILAALFFPLATLGTVLGTTLTDGWTWSQSPGPFALFLIVGIVCGMGLAVYVTRRVPSMDRSI